MKIEIGKTYFYNNAPVTVLKEEPGGFYLVYGDVEVNTDIEGSAWCTACLAAPPDVIVRHVCHDYQEVIDEAIENAQQTNIFWVRGEFLKDKPVEFIKWEKLNSENSDLITSNSLMTAENNVLKNKNEKLGDEISKQEQNIDRLQKTIDAITEDHDNILKEVQKRKIDQDSILEVSGSGIKLSVARLLELLESEHVLESLKAGGVANWEWYGESYPENSTSTALEILISMKN